MTRLHHRYLMTRQRISNLLCTKNLHSRVCCCNSCNMIWIAVIGVYMGNYYSSYPCYVRQFCPATWVYN